MKYKTIIGIVNLTSDRRKHIITRHPIMENYLKNLRSVLEYPKEIHYSGRTNEVLLFYRHFDNIESGKYIVVVVNKIEKQVKTSYLSNRIKFGRKYE